MYLLSISTKEGGTQNKTLPRSTHLKIFLIWAFWWRRFKSAYPFLTFFDFFFYICFFLSVFFFASFFFYYYYLSIFFAFDEDNFLSKAPVFHCFIVTSYRWIHFPSSVLLVLSTSPVVVHSFPRNILGFPGGNSSKQARLSHMHASRHDSVTLAQPKQARCGL